MDTGELEEEEQIEPAPDLKPEEVVELALRAFATSKSAGARTLWQLGASKLHRSLGDTAHLEHLLSNELYAPLLDSREVESEAPMRIGDSFRQQVTITTGAGVRARYLFALSRSNPENGMRCWLVSGIEREV